MTSLLTKMKNDEDEGEELQTRNTFRKIVKREDLAEKKPHFPDPEILPLIFKSLDFDRLKICRLVSKQWNEEVCRHFSNSSVAVLQHPFKYSEFRALTESGERLKLPVPFHELFVHNYFTGDQNIEDLLHLKTLFPITKLTLMAVQQGVSSELANDGFSLLKHCSPTLTHLKTQFWKSPSSELTELNNLKFPKLEAFTAAFQPRTIRLTEGDENSIDPDELSFFTRIIAEAPRLQLLRLDRIRAVPQLLQEANLTNLRRLFISSFRPNPAIWSTLERLEINALVQLSLKIPLSGEEEPQDWRNFVSRFSASLQQLELHFVRTPNFPSLPALTHLSLDAFRVGRMCFKNLPALRTLKLGNVYPATFARTEPVNADFSPVPQVEEVSFDSLGTVSICSSEVSNAIVSQLLQRFPNPNDIYFPEDSKALVSQLLQCFPNALDWNMSYDCVSDFCQAAGSCHFPVKKLRIELNFRNSCLGETYDPTTAAMEYEEYYETINLSYRNKAIAEDIETFSKLNLLPDLQHLDIINGKNMAKSMNMNINKIDFLKMPNVQSLRFFSIGCGQVNDLKAVLRSLKSVTVFNYCGHRWTREDEDFLVDMPNVHYGQELEDFPDLRPPRR